MQIDRVVVPPGFFNPARTYSLVRDDAGIYMIFTGPAMGTAPAGGGVAGLAAGAILDRMADKRSVQIAEVEAKLRASSAAAMKDTKHSRFIPRTAIKAITVQDAGSHPVVTLVADKKVKLHFHAAAAANVRAFFEGLAP